MNERILDDAVMQVFCRQPLRQEQEGLSVVAFLLADRPGSIFVGVTDDNDYHDARFPVRQVDGAAGLILRAGDEPYPWETLMRQFANEIEAK